jgi:antitoxin Phd
MPYIKKPSVKEPSPTMEGSSSRTEGRSSLNLNRRGQFVSLTSMSATAAKNEFGRALETALRDGYVVITKHDQPKAVLVALDEFEALTRSQNPKLEALSAEFDRLLESMQSPNARSVIQSVFESSSDELGRAALEGHRRGS